MMRKKAFTLIELLVVISIILLLLSILTPVLNKVKEAAKRKVCAGNVAVVGKAMHMYAAEYGTMFPNDSFDKPGVNYIGSNRTVKTTSTEPASKAGNSRSMYLLVLKDYAVTAAFLCPSTDDTPDPPVPAGTAYYDFLSHKTLSFSYQVQKKSGNDNYPTSKLSSPALAMLADRNPIAGRDSWQADGTGAYAAPDADAGHVKDSGTDEYLKNSYNHKQAGQNVFFADSSVRWCETPNVGITNTTTNAIDNIWCSGPGATEPGTGIANATSTSEEDAFVWP